MRSVLLVPISPMTIGVGLAGRVRQWQDSLSRIGEVTTIVVPVAGTSDSSEITITPGPDTDETLPRLARGLTEVWGQRHRMLAASADVIVAVRSYLGLLALGMSEATNAPVVVDLDDDDADYFRQRGDAAEADRFERLVDRLRDRHVILTSASGFGDTTCVPNSVPVPANRSRMALTQPRVLCVGNFRYEPNVEGAQWFIDRVLPLLRVRIRDLDLRLVGPASERFEPYGAGIIEDIADEYDQANVAVCPILVGSGTRTKIIEAWMHHVPVVSTSIGSAGLGAQSGVHVLNADTPEAFAEAIVSVLSDPSESDRLVQSGHAHALASFSPDIVASAVASIIHPVTTDRTRSYVTAPNLHLTETDDGLVVLDRTSDVVHTLNSTASMVLLLADGTLDCAGIAAEIRSILELEESPLDHVTEAMESLCALGLVHARIQAGAD